MHQLSGTFLAVILASQRIPCRVLCACCLPCRLQAAMIADYTEGRMDESRRAALHAEYEEMRDAKDVKQMLEALKRGFRRKKRGLAGLDGEDVSGRASPCTVWVEWFGRARVAVSGWCGCKLRRMLEATSQSVFHPCVAQASASNVHVVH
jgi:hypothetical protein